MFEDTLLVVKLETLSGSQATAGREVIQKLIASDNIERLPRGTKIVAAVSEDVDLNSDMEVMWGIFTRFDAARDVLFTKSTLAGSSQLMKALWALTQHGSQATRTHASCRKRLLSVLILVGANTNSVKTKDVCSAPKGRAQTRPENLTPKMLWQIE